MMVVGMTIAGTFRTVSTGGGVGHLVGAAAAGGVGMAQAGEQMEPLSKQGHQREKRRKIAANRAVLRKLH